ncbi:MAG: hypothetical protein ACRC14_07715 [Paracoccaceae bacterium]
MPRRMDQGPRKPRIHVQDVPRSSDDIVLSILRLRLLGLPERQIAARLRVPRSLVGMSALRVRKDDLKFSVPMEDRAAVEAAYP